MFPDNKVNIIGLRKQRKSHDGEANKNGAAQSNNYIRWPVVHYFFKVSLEKTTG